MDDGAVGGVYEDVIADGAGCDADFIHGVEGVLRHSALRRLAIPIRLALVWCHGDDLFVCLAVCCGFGRSPGSGAGLVFADEGDVVLVGLGLGHLDHGVDPFSVTGQMLLVQIVVAAGRGYDADDAEGSSDFCIAGRADFIFNRNKCILPFFLGHDEFLLSSITYS